MEFKVCFTAANYNVAYILIESKWNLKMRTRRISELPGTHINRIKVEFKAIRIRIVDKSDLYINRIKVEFKAYNVITGRCTVSDINRIKVEFKAESSLTSSRVLFILIESKWNLKTNAILSQ